ncbi:MAG: DUF6897 domain-containing protein [Turicibacter sp.]
MNEIIKNYVGKECIIYTLSQQISGTIETIETNWIVVKTNSGEEIINVDFIIRIREYPLTKKGKKKTVFLD